MTSMYDKLWKLKDSIFRERRICAPENMIAHTIAHFCKYMNYFLGRVSWLPLVFTSETFFSEHFGNSV